MHAIDMKVDQRGGFRREKILAKWKGKKLSELVLEEGRLMGEIERVEAEQPIDWAKAENLRQERWDLVIIIQRIQDEVVL